MFAVCRDDSDINHFVDLFLILQHFCGLFPGKATNYTLFTKKVQSCAFPFLHQSGATDNRVRNGACKAAEVADGTGKGILCFGVDVTGDSAIKRGAEIN